MLFLAQSPQTWAEIAEKLGIPFAILLFVFFAITAASVWTARNVVKPVVASHIKFVADCGETLGALRNEETKQTGAIVALKTDSEQLREKVVEVHRDVRQMKGIVGGIARKQSDTRGTSSSAELPAAQ